ncbi:MAG: hypothetical protein ACRCYV_04270 [Aeromonas sp.]
MGQPLTAAALVDGHADQKRHYRYQLRDAIEAEQEHRWHDAAALYQQVLDIAYWINSDRRQFLQARRIHCLRNGQRQHWKAENKDYNQRHPYYLTQKQGRMQ